jgi:hypothetical protein
MSGKPDLLANLGMSKSEIVESLKKSPNGQIHIHRFIPLLFANPTDANALSLRVSTGLISTRSVNHDEFHEIIGRLKDLGHENYVYSRCRSKNGRDSDMVIFDALDDSLGQLTELAEDIKMLNSNLKIKPGISMIERDRLVIVQDKFWSNNADRPRGFFHTDDLV